MDLKLTNGDLTIENGDLVMVDGLEAIAQDVTTRLRMFLGEWFLDTSKGVPFYQRIFVKNPSVPLVLSTLSAVVTGTAGILSITDGLTWSYEGATREASVSFKANTVAGPLDYGASFGLGVTVVTALGTSTNTPAAATEQRLQRLESHAIVHTHGGVMPGPSSTLPSSTVL